MKSLKYLILVLLISSCSIQKKNFEYYQKVPVKYAKKKVEYPNKDFSIFIPKNWQWKDEQYNHENLILGIDAGSKPDNEGYLNIISIQKAKSFSGSSDLEREYEFYLKMLNQNPNSGKVDESGLTNIFNAKTYFISTKPINKNQIGTEMIMLLTESETEGVFYYLTGSVSQTKDLETNKAIVIQSLATFKR
ncbi:hypothetical protein LRR18_10955 [Mangrovimonas sp. AS39]|uniref:hypothetical protein n=1 Tax=Mangrovimonas futianensis TaxID=2895523 RepID=UPI001E42D2C5|nr:hypothetical protein [Mangrovimonas futianensis]MCF1192103.1 hypothetical protein [Mangrovimonas futianensis]MCF1195797.1 hypothetical protein [Mangrovimonas futianensis]